MDKIEKTVRKLHVDNQDEDLFQIRQVWLEFYGYNEEDVLVDDEGFEYVLTIDESGTPGCDYQVDECKIYIRV